MRQVYVNYFQRKLLNANLKFYRFFTVLIYETSPFQIISNIITLCIILNGLIIQVKLIIKTFILYILGICLIQYSVEPDQRIISQFVSQRSKLPLMFVDLFYHSFFFQVVCEAIDKEIFELSFRKKGVLFTLFLLTGLFKLFIKNIMKKGAFSKYFMSLPSHLFFIISMLFVIEDISEIPMCLFRPSIYILTGYLYAMISKKKDKAQKEIAMLDIVMNLPLISFLLKSIEEIALNEPSQVEFLQITTLLHSLALCYGKEQFIEYLNQVLIYSRAESICPICLRSQQINHQLEQTNCKHVFHSSCLEIWKKMKSQCPLCRGRIT